MTSAPSKAELATAPILKGWLLEHAADSEPWLYAWFFGDPDVEDGDHGHASAVLQIDESSPPGWARTESQLYRLGASYPPAEREIRYWAQKLRKRLFLPLGDAPGGGNDIDEMIAFIREERPFPERRLMRMELAYREERERLTEVDALRVPVPTAEIPIR
ncbi:hypothetical protein FZ934_23460 (plasmid) [Rhizobium grahamii]|uniref:Uncharacterized protein n=1 Tax=Rhizobium grahamii TaxID=1120045 RepID=A0A5Q0CCX8_9HYPH|nr:MULTISPECIES: DUF6634 family protein [Rhizobium]QFY63252.1 hypothetical protein FZ934_23460 [Rhizobium grahamii]QRM51984.1 hypothetical protein F3Y33_22190 [Rhizobium sp. BG6]